MLCLELPAAAADQAQRLEVAFHWQANRFRHVIVLRDSSGTAIESWQDHDAADNTDWPQSAPIQQLSREEINGQMTLLGVGQAGVSHWSVCVEPTEYHGAPALRFDFACRVKQPPQWLGSTYQVETHLTPGAAAPARLALALESDADFAVHQPSGQRQVALRTEALPQTRMPATYRWAYVIHPSPLL